MSEPRDSASGTGTGEQAAPPESPGQDGWGDARLAAALFALDPSGLGLHLIAAPGPEREILRSWVASLLGAPPRRLPVGISEERLLGGVDLAGTLQARRLVRARGLLAEANGGVVEVAGAERLPELPLRVLCAALDHASLILEREGLSERTETRVGVLALDEREDGEEGLAAPLRDRLALTLDLRRLPPLRLDGRLRCALAGPPWSPSGLDRARRARTEVSIPGNAVEVLCAAAGALGIDSLRAPLLAVRVARAHAALRGAPSVEAEDLEVAARLVLAPRAQRLPAPELEESPEPERSASSPAEPPAPSTEPGLPSEKDSRQESPCDPCAEDTQRSEAWRERVIDAARSAMPEHALEDLVLRAPPKGRSGKRGAARASLRGRPAGVRARRPRDGERLHLVDTLRAAAPWQAFRGRTEAIEIRPSDFRVRCFQARTETCVVFAVDASGSSAARRLAEAKGAVEQVLGECYARRDHVALIAFRGVQAEVLLPPTRSLARARRCLAGLVGGGPTPLASGIDAATRLALESHRRGQSPLVVLMTDGRANVARNGAEGSFAGHADAELAARSLRTADVPALFLDTSIRPRRRARMLADAMGARYVPLPHVDASRVAHHVRAVSSGESSLMSPLLTSPSRGVLS